MILFFLSFQYYTNLYHNIYDYETNSYAVTNYLLNTRGSRWNNEILLMKYKEDFGLKRFHYRFDSISIGDNGFYHFELGDKDYLRGVEFGYTPLRNNLQFNIRIGKMRDLTARVFPTFYTNNFFSEMELFLPNHKLTLSSRWDRDRTSTILGDKFNLDLGAFRILSDINLGYMDSPKVSINQDLFYNPGLFSIRSFIRYYSRSFVSREGIEYIGGRFNWGVNPSYNFPIGLNVFSGFYQTGRLDRPLQNQVLDGFSYRFPFNLSVNFTNNVNWGGDRASGYRNYLSLYYHLYDKARLSFRYSNSNYNRINESFEAQAIINLPYSNVLEASISNSTFYGLEYSLGATLRINSSIYGDFRLRNMTEQERLSYNASIFYDSRGGFSSRISLSGNTGTGSKIYTLELTKRGKIEEAGFGTIKGRVWQDENGDGQKQKEEPPVRNISIILDGKKKTGVNRIGEYTFGPIPKGKHTIELDMKGIPAFLGGDSLKKTVRTSLVDFKVVDFPIFSLSSVSGIVYYDNNHNYTRDSGEKGVPNVKVSIIQGHYSRYTYTNFLGEYSIHNIVPGDYTIQASRLPPGYHLSPRGFVLYLELTGGIKKDGLNFGIAKPAKEIERKEF